jgi:hypothetical protein
MSFQLQKRLKTVLGSQPKEAEGSGSAQCPQCHGRGVIEVDDWAAPGYKRMNTCPQCDGSGVISSPKKSSKTAEKSARDVEVGDVIEGKTVSKVDKTTTPGVVYVYFGDHDPPADMTLNHGDPVKTASLTVEATTPPTGKEFIDLCRDVLANGVYGDNRELKGVDAFTASAVTQVYDALSPENKAKMETLPTSRLVDIVWKLVNKSGSKTASKMTDAIVAMRTKIEGLSPEQRKGLEDGMAVDFQEHFQYQEQQARAHAMGKISTEDAQVIYNALGEVGSSSNGGWAADTDLATKVVVTQAIGQLLGMTLGKRSALEDHIAKRMASKIRTIAEAAADIPEDPAIDNASKEERDAYFDYVVKMQDGSSADFARVKDFSTWKLQEWDLPKTQPVPPQPYPKREVAAKTAGNPHPTGSPAWFRWEHGEDPDRATYGPKPGGTPEFRRLFPEGVPLDESKWTDEQREYWRTHKTISRKTASDEGEPPTLYPDSDCRLVYEGEDEAGDVYLCTTHNNYTLGDQVPCEEGSFGKESSKTAMNTTCVDCGNPGTNRRDSTYLSSWGEKPEWRCEFPDKCRRRQARQQRQQEKQSSKTTADFNKQCEFPGCTKRASWQSLVDSPEGLPRALQVRGVDSWLGVCACDEHATRWGMTGVSSNYIGPSNKRSSRKTAASDEQYRDALEDLWDTDPSKGVFNGFPYLGYIGNSQRNYLTDEWAFAGARELGWTPQQFVEWACSKEGRWSLDAAPHSAADMLEQMKRADADVKAGELRLGSKQAVDEREQAGQAESTLPEVEPEDEQAKQTMFPWEIDTQGRGAADVAGVPTPGRGVGDYPQPKQSAVNVGGYNCRYCGNPIEKREDPVGYGRTWADADGYGDDRDFQCGVNPRGTHVPDVNEETGNALAAHTGSLLAVSYEHVAVKPRVNGDQCANCGSKNLCTWTNDGVTICEDCGTNHRISAGDPFFYGNGHGTKMPDRMKQASDTQPDLPPHMDEEFLPLEPAWVNEAEGEDAADVASVPTPGGEAGYPQPKRSDLQHPQPVKAFHVSCEQCGLNEWYDEGRPAIATHQSHPHVAVKLTYEAVKTADQKTGGVNDTATCADCGGELRRRVSYPDGWTHVKFNPRCPTRDDPDLIGAENVQKKGAKTAERYVVESHIDATDMDNPGRLYYVVDSKTGDAVSGGFPDRSDADQEAAGWNEPGDDRPFGEEQPIVDAYESRYDDYYEGAKTAEFIGKPRSKFSEDDRRWQEQHMRNEHGIFSGLDPGRDLTPFHDHQHKVEEQQGRATHSHVASKTQSFIATVQANLNKQAMPNPADLGVKVGDIFSASWGYDQTNVDFYEVVRLTGASVVVRKIASRDVGGGAAAQWSGKAVPVPGQYTGEEMTKRIITGYQGRPSFKVTSYSWASLWDGEPEYYSTYASKKEK